MAKSRDLGYRKFVQPEGLSSVPAQPGFIDACAVSWWESWLAAWAEIGWLASTDQLQGLIVGEMNRREKELEVQLHNLNVELTKLRKEVRRARPAR